MPFPTRRDSLHRLAHACVHMCACVCVLGHISLFETPWTIAHQAPLSMGFSRQEEMAFPSLRDLPDPGIEPTFLESPALADRFFTTITTWEALLPSQQPHHSNLCFHHLIFSPSDSHCRVTSDSDPPACLSPPPIRTLTIALGPTG